MKHKRPNPLKLTKGVKLPEALTEFMGDTLVIASLRGCSLEEKTLISGLMPTFLKLIRSGESVMAFLEAFHEKAESVEDRHRGASRIQPNTPEATDK